MVVPELCVKCQTMKYLYTVWFRDNSVPKDDQDYEWPACIIINAKTESNALIWGNHLAKKYSKETSSLDMLWSKVESVFEYSECDLSTTPIIEYGYEASNSEIGW